MIDETIKWRRCEDEKPDADTTVLLYDVELDGEPIWPGHYADDVDEWYVDGYTCTPTHWAPMPNGPLGSGGDAT